MWHDNESEVDLLGFDTLADTVVLLVAQKDLLPLTIGVFSDWGGGKSSLMAQARHRIAAKKKDDGKDQYICLTFNPWQHEDYDDVKAAMMAAVMSALTKHQSFLQKVQGAAVSKAQSLATKLLKRVNWFRVIGFAAKGLGSLFAVQHGQPGVAMTLAGSGITDIAAVVNTVGEVGSEILNKEEKSDQPKEPIEQSIGEFRRDFGELLSELDVDALVIFIDDLDRCLPDAVVDTLEAIRLFLAVPKTVFVIGADETIVRDAVATRYPELARQAVNVGSQYLEKMVQMPIRIPSLTQLETESYLNLLGCQKYLPERANEFVAKAAEVRKSGSMSIAMDEGIARGIIPDLPAELIEHFQIVARITPALCGRFNGNPRRTKRFMNTFLMRQGLATGRSVDLDPAVLAKLMILEFYEAHYRQVFTWQQEGSGYALPLEELEFLAAKSVGGKVGAEQQEYKEWLTRPELHEWLTLEPRLAKVDLGPYFYFSRDTALAKIAQERRLRQTLQELLGRLQSESDAERTTAKTEALKLDAQDFKGVYDALLSRFVRDPRTLEGKLGPLVVQLAALHTDAVPDLTKTLRSAPLQRIQPSLPLVISTSFNNQMPTDVKDVVQGWADQNEVQALKRNAQDALAGPKLQAPGRR